MKRQLLVCIGVAAVVSSAGLMAQAQGASQAGTQGAKGGSSTTLTGCLAKGGDATSFVLNDAMPAAAAGKEQSKEAAKSTAKRSYQVMASESSLKLADHVGHTVTLTGTVDTMAGGASASGSGAAKGSGSGAATGAGGSSAGAGGSSAGAAGSSAGAAGSSAGGKAGAMPHFMVTSMKHVSTTCTQ